jgi:YVTN family beta-propeller protein
VSYVRLAILIVSFVFPAVVRAADGSVHIYLQPLPAEAARLTFSIVSLTAVASTGEEFPLTLNVKTIGPSTAGRQRLLASGRLPAGSYTRFLVSIGQASLKDRDAGPLTLPDAPAPIDFPFSVGPGQPPLVWLKLDYAGSIGTGGQFAPAFVAMTPAKPIVEHSAFVTNSRSDTLTIIDTSLGQAAGVIDTCDGPAGLSLDEPRRRLFVACTGDDQIQAIDIATGRVIDRAQASPGDRPRELAVTPDGLTLLVVNSGSDSVSLFDATSLARRERITVGNGPQSIVVEPSGRRAFVFNTFSSSISVLDLQNRTVSGTISTEAAPLRGVLDRRGDRLFVIHERSPYMTVLDARQLTVLSRARLRAAVTAVAIDPVRNLVCVGGEQDTSIDFYDPNALVPLYSMKVPAGIVYLAVDAVDNRLYVVSRKGRSVAIAALGSRKLTSEVDVGEEPYWISVAGAK